MYRKTEDKEMFGLGRKELETLASNGGKKASRAKAELERRNENKADRKAKKEA